MHLGQVPDRAPVGVVDDVLDVVVGFFLGGAADDADGRPHLNRAPVRACESLRLRDTRGARLRRLDRIEVHVGVSNREQATGLGAPGVHHPRHALTVRSQWEHGDGAASADGRSP